MNDSAISVAGFPQKGPPIRGLRVIANFTRMIFGFVLGLWFIRLLLNLGTEAAAVVIFLGVGMGVGAIAQQLLQRSLTPALALAYHSKDRQRLRDVYCACVAICIVVAAIASALYFVLWLSLAVLQFPAELKSGARWFVASLAVRACAVILFTPRITMLMAQGRMVAWNLCRLTDRVADILAIVMVLLLAFGDASKSLAMYGMFAAGIQSLFLILFAIQQRRENSFIKFGFQHISQDNIKEVLRSVGGNSLLVIASALYLRVDMLLINLSGGLLANLIFGIAMQLTGYVGQLTRAQALGLESTSARIVTHGQLSALRGIIQTSSRHQAILILPAIGLLAILAGPVIHVWIGSKLANEVNAVAAAAIVLRLMLLGMVARALTEGWLRILNGAGSVTCYARPLLIGGLINIGVVATLIWFLPPSLAAYLAATIYAVLHIVVHLLWLPSILSSLLDISIKDIWLPIFRPLAVSVVCLPLLLVGYGVEQWSLLVLAAVATPYLLAYGITTFFVSLNQDEQQWIKRILLWDFSSNIEQPRASACRIISDS